MPHGSTPCNGWQVVRFCMMRVPTLDAAGRSHSSEPRGSSTRSETASSSGTGASVCVACEALDSALEETSVQLRAGVRTPEPRTHETRSASRPFCSSGHKWGGGPGFGPQMCSSGNGASACALAVRGEPVAVQQSLAVQRDIWDELADSSGNGALVCLPTTPESHRPVLPATSSGNGALVCVGA